MKIKITSIIILSSFVYLMSCAQDKGQDSKLDSQIDSVSYSLGILYVQNLSRDGLDSLNPWMVARAFEDFYKGRELEIGQEEAQTFLMDYFTTLQEKQMMEQFGDNKSEGEKFLEENKTKDGVVVLPSGLQYMVLKEGTGPKPQATDEVKVYYKGWLVDGKVFEETPEGEPVTFYVNQVITGWTEALQLMNVGSKWRVFVPSDLAYGAEYRQGSPIEPFSTLVFEIELLGIE